MSSPDRSEQLLDQLRTSRGAGRLAHAYVLIGDPRGEAGEFSTRFAQMVLCEGLTPPCGACGACEKVGPGTHPDLMRLEPEKKSRIIGVEAMRDLTNRLAQKAFLSGGWKVAILDHADRLNEDAANAFLKTLEEPPPRTLILLLTDAPQALLPTILSRCQRIQVEAGERRFDRSWSDALLDLLAQPSAGGVLERMARARQLHNLLEAERERIGKEVDAELRKLDEPPAKEVRDARVDAEVKKVRSEMLQTLILWNRDVLALHLGTHPDHLHFPERLSDLQNVAKGRDTTSLLDSINAQKTLVRRVNQVAKFEIQAFEAYFL